MTIFSSIPMGERFFNIKISVNEVGCVFPQNVPIKLCKNCRDTLRKCGCNVSGKSRKSDLNILWA